MTPLVEGARLLAAAAIGLGALPLSVAVAREGWPGVVRRRAGEQAVDWLDSLESPESPESPESIAMAVEQRALVVLTVHGLLQAAAAVLLGALHLYRLEPALLLEAALAAGGLLWLRAGARRGSPELARTSTVGRPEPVEDARGRVDRDATRAAGGAAAGRGLVGRAVARAGEDLAARLPLAAAGVLGALLLWRLLSRAIVDYDSLAYHLPTLARWIQAGGAAWIEQYRGTQIGAYPYAWEAWCGLLALPLHDDVLAALPNLLAWAQLGLATSCVAQRLGAGRVAARLAALALLALPVVVEAPATLHIDLALGAYAIAGLAFALAAPAGAGLPAAVLALACAAMLPAIKMSGLVYGGLLVAGAPALWAILGLPLRDALAFDRGAGRAGGPAGSAARRSLLAATAMALCALGCGAYFYARNLVVLGNPLGRMEVRLGPLVVFAGDADFTREVRRTTLAALFHAGDGEHRRVLLQVLDYYFGGLGAGLLLLGALGLVAAAHPRTRTAARRGAVAAAALLVTCVVLYWFTPYTGDNGSNGWRITPWIGQALRYGYPAIAALALLASLGLRLVPARPWLVGLLSLAPVVAALARLGRQDHFERLHFPGLGEAGLPGWVEAVGPALLVMAALVALVVRARWGIVAGLVALLVATAIARPVRDADRARVYGPVYRYLASHPGGRLAYAVGDRSYPWFGARLGRAVEIVGNDALRDPALEQRLAHMGATWLALGPSPPGQSLPVALPLSAAWHLVVPPTVSPWGGQSALYEWQVPPVVRHGQ